MMQVQQQAGLDRSRAPLASPLSAIWTRGLIEAVELAGVPHARFLAEAGIPVDQLDDPYGWTRGDDLDRLPELAVRLTGDDALGLHWGAHSPMSRFDVFPLLVANAPTARHALDAVFRFQPLLWRPRHVDAEERNHVLYVRCLALGPSQTARRVRSELVVYGLLRLLRYAGVEDRAVRRISFTHARPSYASEYRRVFDKMPEFRQASCGLELAARSLDRPILGANAELFELLLGQANMVLSRLQRGTGYAERALGYVRTVLPHVPHMPETAGALAMSARSLRRRLADEGELYTRIVERAQQGLARQLLEDPARSIKQVGQEVGFSTTAAFHRAFRRWAGCSPSVYRATDR